MKFNCGPTQKEWIAAREQWHIWFAWFPVRIEANKCAWLETVQRLGTAEILGRFNSDYYELRWSFEYKLRERKTA